LSFLFLKIYVFFFWLLQCFMWFFFLFI